ncbi:hypothetical protein C8R43DRAFT_404981 [Mycena crocata]|nr:hypothetical protein C8R43DRAFT_404981 [Mycena crocata]
MHANFQHEMYDDSDQGSGQDDFNDVPPLLLTPTVLLANRGRELEVAINGGHTDTRTFISSPQPTYDRGVDEHVLLRPVKEEFPQDPRNFHEGYGNHHNLHPQTTQPDYMVDPYMASNLQHPSCQQSQAYTGMEEDVDTGFRHTGRPGIYSTHSSPGYLPHDLPTAISRFEHTRHHSGDYQGISHVPYHSGGRSSFSSVSSWDTYPEPPTPCRPSNIQSRPHSPSHVFNAFGHYPPSGELRHIPQMFKIKTEKKKSNGTKKQMMACLFCRERKIGCLRPPEDDPDQTCNQCARRDKKCEYPTESRRGQHNRNRAAKNPYPVAPNVHSVVANTYPAVGNPYPEVASPSTTPTPPTLSLPDSVEHQAAP